MQKERADSHRRQTPDRVRREVTDKCDRRFVEFGGQHWTAGIATGRVAIFSPGGMDRISLR